MLPLLLVGLAINLLIWSWSQNACSSTRAKLMSMPQTRGGKLFPHLPRSYGALKAALETSGGITRERILDRLSELEEERNLDTAYDYITDLQSLESYESPGSLW